MPGTSSALRQVPLTSLTTNGSMAGLVFPMSYWPPAAQFPADAQDTEVRAEPVTGPPPSVASVARPGTSSAGCQRPLTSVATHACVAPAESVNDPPAAHRPPAAHHTAAIEALSSAGYGTSAAVPHRPPRSLSVNHCPFPPLSV